MSSCSHHTPGDMGARAEISVNGVILPHELVAAEAQNHPAASPAQAFQQAAQALAIRELLLQEADRLGIAPEPETDAQGRRETDEDARIRALIASALPKDAPDEESCRRFYDQNLARFHAPELYHAAHILIAAEPGRLDEAEAAAWALLETLKQEPAGFAGAAHAISACPSRDQGGDLGLIAPGQLVEEVEQALLALAPGELAAAPVRSRFGWHILKLERKISGECLPFAAVQPKIAAYLTENRARQTIAGLIGHLAAKANLRGVALGSGE